MTTPYRQLILGQRYQIEMGLACKQRQAGIAKQLDVHPATISREARRNGSTQPDKVDATMKKFAVPYAPC